MKKNYYYQSLSQSIDFYNHLNIAYSKKQLNLNIVYCLVITRPIQFVKSMFVLRKIISLYEKILEKSNVIKN